MYSSTSLFHVRNSEKKHDSVPESQKVYSPSDWISLHALDLFDESVKVRVRGAGSVVTATSFPCVSLP